MINKYMVGLTIHNLYGGFYLILKSAQTCMTCLGIHNSLNVIR